MATSGFEIGDKVVFETSDGYTTLGVIDELPPWGHDTIDVTYDNRVKMRVSESMPTYQAVKIENIVGLEENYTADVHTL